MAASMRIWSLVSLRGFCTNLQVHCVQPRVTHKKVHIIQSAFPIIKLATLGAKQISKPIAKGVKRMGKNNHLFGRYVCAPPAQLYHWLEVNLKMRVLGLGKATEVAPLSEKSAIELGADMIGEIIVFGVAVGCLIFEYWRQAKKEEKHENTQTAAIYNLKRKVEDMGIEMERQDAKLRELNRMILTPSQKQKVS